jgi:hypothetical protein
MTTEHWKQINSAISARWPKGLQRIKDMAWKLVGKACHRCGSDDRVYRLHTGRGDVDLCTPCMVLMGGPEQLARSLINAMAEDARKTRWHKLVLLVDGAMR